LQNFDGDPLTGPSNAGGVGTNRDSRRIAACYRSITGGVRTTSATVYRAAVYRTDGNASGNLRLSQPAACTTTTKRRKQNRIYLYAAVNLKRNLPSTGGILV